MATTPCVAFVQRRLPAYRVPLLNRMRAQLAGGGIGLRFLHGEPSEQEALRGDSANLDWAERLPTRYLAGGRLVWQPFLERAGDCDLIITSQENKLLHNHLALIQPRRRAALAYFGHGRNLQARGTHAAREWFKRRTTRAADWWFAYTQGSADIVAATGYPRERISVVDNSIDTLALRLTIDTARARGRPACRRALGLPEQGPLVSFIGSLVAEKRPGRLLEVARSVLAARPDAQFAIAGDGPEREPLMQALPDGPGQSAIRALGLVDEPRKALLLAASDLLIQPGAAGLGVLDAFAAGLPQVLAAEAGHGPEAAYVESGRQGLVVPDAALADAVLALLRDPQLQARLGEGARAAGLRFTIEGMSDRFCAGIEACLAMWSARR